LVHSIPRKTDDENPLAVEVLGSKSREGDHVVIDTRDRETFTFKKEAAVAQPA
jgi:hypothetical protein